MADEPTLPTLPGPLKTSTWRKRPRETGSPSTLFSTSSDPAVFSSDDDPALDNYAVHGRRKKRYVGTWFDQHLAASSDSADSAMGDEMRPPSTKPRQRQFRRQLDSGVWMAQGDSTDTEDSMVDIKPSASRLPLHRPAYVHASSPPCSPTALALRSRYSPKESAVQRIVQGCIDGGDEIVDLSNLGLQKISGALLEPIAHIAPIPTVTKNVPFEQRQPELKVYLYGNALQSFPGALLNIENLTVLSLRGNKLTELPPGIASLTNLQALNVAQNRLSSLPGELLKLLQKGSALRSLQFHPNPFFQPEEPSYCQWGTAEYEHGTFGPQPNMEMDQGEWEGITTTLRARTPVQVLSRALNVSSKFAFPPDHMLLGSQGAKLEQENFFELALPEEAELHRRVRPDGTRIYGSRGVPSLFELVLKKIAQYPDPEEVKEILETDNSLPGHFPRAYQRALDRHQTGGGQTCCVCGRNTYNPITEWVEFREVQRTLVKVEGEGDSRVEVKASTRIANSAEEAPEPQGSRAATRFSMMR